MKVESENEKETPGKHFVFQYLAAFTATLSTLMSGMHYGWPTPSLPQLQNENSTIAVTGGEGSWMAVMPFLGASAGATLGILIVDRIGRKKSVLLTSVPFFIAWIMVAFSESVVIILIARFIAGLGDGMAFCCVPMYLGEIASSNIRGVLGAMGSTTMILGMLLITAIGSFTSIKTAALVSTSVPILLLITFVWMPESPYYLLMKNQTERAKRSLQIFKNQRNVSSDLERIRLAIVEQNTNTGKFLDLFLVKSNRKALFIMFGLRGLQQCSGIMAITFYVQIIFKDAGDDISASAASIIYFGVQLICSSVGSVIMDKTGRKPLLIVSTVGTGVAIFIEALFFYIRNRTHLDISNYSYVGVAALIVFIIFYAIGLQTIPLVLLGELFPTNVKAFASGFLDIYYNVAATTVSKFFQIVKDSYGIHVPCFAFALCCGINLIFIIFCVPETKGKTLEAILTEFKGKNKFPKTELEMEQAEVFIST